MVLQERQSMAMEENEMKLFTPLSIAALTLLLGAPAISSAQDDPRPPKQEQEEPKPEPKADPDKAKPAQGDEDRPKDTKPEDMKRQDTKPSDVKPPKDEPGPARDNARENGKAQEHPDNAQQHARPTGKSVRIPDDKFRAHFGREHTVVIRQPVIVEGQPRFQFGGYWFVISDPWPMGWAYTDECYVDFVDGEYFLFDVLHPGVRVALFVTM
jgi:hypothetical protein